MKKLLNLLTLLVLSFSSFSQALEEVTIVSNGINRKFYLKLPVAASAIQQSYPVIIGLHGDGGTGNGFASSSGLANLTSTMNFIGVFPNATVGGWNRAVQGQSPANDVKFIEDIIDYLYTNYFINRNKIYAVGHSAGGFMSYRLAIEKADKIAGICSVAGNLYGDAANNGQAFMNNYLGGANFIKIPILHIHGDSDGTVSYPDPNHQPDEWSEFPLTGFSYPTCGSTTYNASNVTNINANVKRIPYCEDGATSKPITLLRIVGGGHEWHSTKLPDISTRIVDFLLPHSIAGQPVCGSLGIDDAEVSAFKIFPNPAQNSVKIETPFQWDKAEVIDLSGKIIFTFNYSSSAIDVSSLLNGVYFIKIQVDGKDYMQKMIKE